MSQQNHRPRIDRKKYYLISMLFGLKIVLIIIALSALLAVPVLEEALQKKSLYVAGGTFACFVLVALIMAIENSSVICPLCRTSYYKATKSVKRSHRKILGSLRLATALDILLHRRRIRCLHCGESVRWREDNPREIQQREEAQKGEGPRRRTKRVKR